MEIKKKLVSDATRIKKHEDLKKAIHDASLISKKDKYRCFRQRNSISPHDVTIPRERVSTSPIKLKVMDDDDEEESEEDEDAGAKKLFKSASNFDSLNQSGFAAISPVQWNLLNQKGVHTI